MGIEAIVHLADILQLATIALSLCGFVPQIVALYRTRDSRGHSLATWSLWTLSSAMATFYALVHFVVDRCCLPLIVTTSVNLALSVTTLLLVARYRAEPKAIPTDGTTGDYASTW